MNYNVIMPDGTVYGPVDAAGLKQWAAEGRIAPTTTIQETGTGHRVQASTIPGLFGPAQNFAQAPVYTTPIPQTAAYPRGQAQQVDNNLIKSIISVFPCGGCLPLGIIAIIYSCQVGSKLAEGDYYGARDSADKANVFANISIGLALVGVVIRLIMFGIGFAHLGR